MIFVNRVSLINQFSESSLHCKQHKTYFFQKTTKFKGKTIFNHSHTMSYTQELNVQRHKVIWLQYYILTCTIVLYKHIVFFKFEVNDLCQWIQIWEQIIFNFERYEFHWYLFGVDLTLSSPITRTETRQKHKTISHPSGRLIGQLRDGGRGWFGPRIF